MKIINKLVLFILIACTIRLTEYTKTENAKQALHDKYFQTITNNNGESTTVYKLDINNPFLDKLLGQHEINGDNYIDLNKSGCNFMSIIAVPQLLTGNILNEDEIKNVWDEALISTFKSYNNTNEILPIVEKNGYVNEPDKLANILWNKKSYGKFANRFTTDYKTNEFLVGKKIKLKYNDSGHFVLGDLDNNIIYNPGNLVDSKLETINIFLRANK